MIEITYVFTRGRNKKLFQNKFESLIFFMEANTINKRGYNLNIVEFNDNKPSKYFFYYFDRFFQKFLSLPFYTNKINSYKNLKIFLNSDKIIFVNESTACSSIFLLLIGKLVFKKVETHMFVMGLYIKKLNYKLLKIFHNLIIKFLCLFIDKIYFLGLGELNNAKKIHNNNLTKLISFPLY